MKLFFAPISPFVRKVMVMAYETGLEGRIEKIPTATATGSPELSAKNPLGKVPTLITDGGEPLFDSPVICEYLDSLHGGRRLFLQDGGRRWQALRWQALGDGLMDAAVAIRYERLRPDNERSATWQEKQKTKILVSARAIEDEAPTLVDTPVTIGHIAIACAFPFIDFRLPDVDWRKGNPRLAAWMAEFNARPSMTATAPRE